MTEATRPAAVLVGPPGAGKTTVGRALAARLGVEFRDTDSDVVALAGKSVADIFVDDGEDRFRELEERAVLAGLATFGGVLALGGGAVGSDTIRAALVGHRVIHLTVGVATAVARVGMNRDRPLLLGNVRAQFRALLDARQPLYERVATATVVTDGKTPDEVTAEALTALPESPTRSGT